MESLEPGAQAGPFGRHDYEIILSPAAWPTVAQIGSLVGEPLRVGDVYTIIRHGDLHDLIVQDIRREVGGRWRARCISWNGARP